MVMFGGGAYLKGQILSPGFIYVLPDELVHGATHTKVAGPVFLLLLGLVQIQ